MTKKDGVSDVWFRPNYHDISKASVRKDILAEIEAEKIAEELVAPVLKRIRETDLRACLSYGAGQVPIDKF